EAELYDRRALLSADLAFSFAERGDHAVADSLYQDLRAFAAAHPHRSLRALQAKAPFNISTVDCAHRDPWAANGKYGVLSELSEAHPDEAELREFRARAANNLANAYNTGGDLVTARALYDELAKMASLHPAEAELGECQFRVARGLIQRHVS